jgi:hypothetical protein
VTRGKKAGRRRCCLAKQAPKLPVFGCRGVTLRPFDRALRSDRRLSGLVLAGNPKGKPIRKILTPLGRLPILFGPQHSGSCRGHLQQNDAMRRNGCGVARFRDRDVFMFPKVANVQRFSCQIECTPAGTRAIPSHVFARQWLSVIASGHSFITAFAEITKWRFALKPEWSAPAVISLAVRLEFVRARALRIDSQARRA